MGVIESRSINEHNSVPIQYEFLRFLNLGCARFELIPDFQMGSANPVHELRLKSELVETNQTGGTPTVDFPLPVTPITLGHEVSHLRYCVRVCHARDERRRIFGVFQDWVLHR